MSNEVTTQQANGGGLVQLDPEQFAGQLARYGEEERTRNWVGQLLKFVRGKYKAGRDETVVPLGTQLTVALDTLEIGWERWQDGRLVDSATGFLCEGYSRRERRELGDNDRSGWPIDKTTGQPRDPWQKVTRVVMYKTKGAEDTLYTFVTRSYGGMSAVGELCEKAGKLMRLEQRGSYPIVALRAGEYSHPKYSSVDIPVFEIVGWDKDPWLGAQIRKEA